LLPRQSSAIRASIQTNDLPTMPATLYRYLTGPDDASFCHRVSDALRKGWQLYGPPTLAYDAEQKRTICGQAITKNIAGDYQPDMNLAEH
jgi:hypothetical protein